MNMAANPLDRSVVVVLGPIGCASARPGRCLCGFPHKLRS